MHETGLHSAFVAPPVPAGMPARHALRRWAWPCGGLLLGLAACTSMPAAFAELAWADQWGDRGQGVLGRDFGMCGTLVESRRSQFSECMAARGWTVGR